MLTEHASKKTIKTKGSLKQGSIQASRNESREMKVKIEVTVPRKEWQKYSRLCKALGYKNEGEFLSRPVSDTLIELFHKNPDLLEDFTNGGED